MTAAARQKLRRSREARGLAVYGVEVGAAVLNRLEEVGLKERDINDRSKVAEALGRVLAEWAEGRLASRVTFIATGGR